MSKNYGISLLRVVSMWMIVFCHIAYYIDASWAAQFLNVGVFVFLLISGWLYSTKPISEPLKWLGQRWRKLCLPILVWMGIIIAGNLLVSHKYPIASDVLLLTCNLQGLQFLCKYAPHLSSEGIFDGCVNLWFVTVIMICYVGLILIKKGEKKFAPGTKMTVVMWISAAFAFVILAYLGFNFAYIFCFFIGYHLGKRKADPSKKQYVVLTLSMAAAMGLRLFVKAVADDTVLYNTVVVGITHTVLAVWIFFTGISLTTHCACIHKFAQGKIIQYMDIYSYYIYITHDYFLHNNFGLRNIVPGLALQMFIFALLTFASAYIIKTITELILKRGTATN